MTIDMKNIEHIKKVLYTEITTCINNGMKSDDKDLIKLIKIYKDIVELKIKLERFK